MEKKKITIGHTSIFIDFFIFFDIQVCMTFDDGKKNTGPLLGRKGNC